MRTLSIRTGLATSLLALGVLGAGAASAQTATNPANPAPATVGVTNQTAAEANQRAVPRSDTGTLVRTGPDAADTTRNATRQATTAAGNAAPMAADTGTAPRARSPRADRN